MRWILGVVLVAFVAYTTWVAWKFGYTSVFTVCFRAHPSTQALVDLWIAGGVLGYIMIVDHLKNGRSFLSLSPYLALTLLLASVGPLLYFMVYPDLLTLQRSSEQSNHS
ncbi:MAG: DUF2834 domain-containing protein [Deltaproteobacteria bacterium]|nr:MAG: DUF2834 domain-containing protein [Deltaproteobacteria bacterium]